MSENTVCSVAGGIGLVSFNSASKGTTLLPRLKVYSGKLSPVVVRAVVYVSPKENETKLVGETWISFDEKRTRGGNFFK